MTVKDRMRAFVVQPQDAKSKSAPESPQGPPTAAADTQGRGEIIRAGVLKRAGAGIMMGSFFTRYAVLYKGDPEDKIPILCFFENSPSGKLKGSNQHPPWLGHQVLVLLCYRGEHRGG